MLPSDVIPRNVTLWRHLPRADHAEHNGVMIKCDKEAQTFSVQKWAWAQQNLQKAQQKFSVICNSTPADQRFRFPIYLSKTTIIDLTANETM